MDALTVGIEHRLISVGKKHTKRIVVLEARLEGLVIEFNLSASLRKYLGIIRERNVRGLQATMPTSVSVQRTDDGYVIAEHDLSWWAEQVRSYHDETFRLQDPLHST